ncbi:MAG: hypothetical protein DMD89_19465 [Candidatus Rokuibacteriota bacterium]|nr:MAG: hypothetical protein DMD89_19465 [Candidatus Rokubacteria bacterium]
MYSIAWANADLSPFDRSNTDKAKIEADHPVPCRLCEAAYRVLTLTMRFCATCEQGYCQPSHGGWVGRRGSCIQCGPQQARAIEREQDDVAPLVPFDVFWSRVKTELSRLPEFNPGYRGLTMKKWTQDKGDLGETFDALYKGGDTLLCDTASTDELRYISVAEVRKVYDVWAKYRAGRVRRGYIVHDLGVQNSTWIIALLKHFEHLMEDAG